jgi:hypothetical protein
MLFTTHSGGCRSLWIGLPGGNFEDGAIVPDADGYARSSSNPPADARDQYLLSLRHDEPNIQGAKAWTENLAGQLRVSREMREQLLPGH